MSEFLEVKKISKKKLSEKISISEKKPLLAVFLDEELNENSDLALRNILEGTKALGVEVVILSDGEVIGDNFSHVKNLDYSRTNRKILLESADIALTFDFNDVEEMLMHGTIPVSAKRAGLEDYNPNRESGNCFIYSDNCVWAIFAALVRAVETFKFPYDWKHLVRQGIKSFK